MLDRASEPVGEVQGQGVGVDCKTSEVRTRRMRAKNGAHAIVGQRKLPPDFVRMAEARMSSLLDKQSLQTRTLVHLLVEAYVVGMADATDILTQPL